MLELIGIAVGAVVLAALLLPFWTFARVHRLSRACAELAARVEALERAAAVDRGAAPQPGPVADPAPVSRDVDTPVRPLRTEPAVAAPVAAASHAGEDVLDFEGQVGGRWLLYTGVVILLLGVSFFLKYAFDNAWVGPWGRIGLGAAGGIGMIAAGLALDRRGLTAFGRALAGGGIAIVYLSVYAALAFYGLIGRPVAFGLMVANTVAAGWLAHQTGAQPLALLGVGGGFLTPFLVGGSGDAEVTLFTYDTLLVLGTLLLARRHRWLALEALSYVLTFASAATWADSYYTAASWWRTLFFLSIFCALFVVMLRETARMPGAAARLVTALLWTAPAAYHLAALVITSDHPPAFHIYLIVFTLAGLLLTASPPRPWLRLLVLLASLAPLFGYVLLPQGPSWLVANLVTVVAVCGLHLMVLVERVSRRHEPLGLGDLLALHLAGLGLFGLLQQTLITPFPAMGGAAAIGTAALAASLWLVFQPQDRLAALNAAALAFTLIAIAIALQFDGRVVVIGWAAEGTAIAWLGLRAPSRAYLAGGLALWAGAALRLTDGYFATPTSFTAIVNERSLATLSVIGLGYAAAWSVRRAPSPAPLAGKIVAGLHVACSLLTLLWISAEIQSYWDVRYETPQAYLYEQLLLSLGWGLYGAGAVVVGMQRAYAPLRYIGILVIGATVLKVFFIDLWDLGGIYRVIGFITLGVLLVLVSYLYQSRRREPDRRDVTSKQPEPDRQPL